MKRGRPFRRFISVCECLKTNFVLRGLFKLTVPDSLLTALSTSRDLTQKSWYNAHLTRRLYRSDREGWSATKNLILSFITMQKAARQPKAQAVRALANDIEIVVDASEARAKGMEIQTSVVGLE